MEINYSHITQTSKEILENLKKSGVELKPEDKQLIIEKVYEAITDTYYYENNGCDCGQMSCPVCHG